MAFPRSHRTNWIVKSYDTTGKASGDLNPFEFAILDKDTYSSLSAVNVQGKEILFAVGSPNGKRRTSGLKVERLGDTLNKEVSFKSQPFTPTAIKTQKFTKETKTNVYYFGYNGVDECKTLEFECGKTYMFDIYVKGRAVRNIYGAELREVIPVTTPCCNPCTDGDCSESIECSVVIDELVRNFNDENRFISRFYTAEKIQSCTPDPTLDTVSFNTYCLTVCDNGDELALAAVQGQVGSSYTRVEVKERNAPYTTYQVTEKVVETGLPSAFVQDATILTNCNECPSGYTFVEGGYAYIIEVDQASSAESSLGTLQALNGFSTLTSRSLMGWSGGVATYSVTASAQLTTTTADAKIVKYIGVIEDTCTQDVAVSTTWSACGSCYKVARTLSVSVGLDDCDASGDIVAEWDAWLESAGDDISEDAEIELVNEAGCFMRGAIIQYSNCVTDGCDTIAAVKWADVPTFKGQRFTETPCAEDTTPTGCLCGIKFTARSFNDLNELLDLPVFDLHEYVEKDPIELTVSLLEPDGTTQVCEDKQPTFWQSQFADFRTLHGRDVMREVLLEHGYRAEPYWNLVSKEALLLQQREGLKYGVDVNAYYFAITISGNVANDLNYTSSSYRSREDVVLFIHEDDVTLFNNLRGFLNGAFPTAKFTTIG